MYQDDGNKYADPSIKRNRTPTIAEKIEQKARTLSRWRDANRQIEWVSQDYPSGNHIALPRDLLRSNAYRSLGKWSLLVYQDLLAKRKMVFVRRNRKKIWQIENNGEIVYPYSEAVANGISRKQFVGAIDELQEKGFIDITHQGKGGRKPANGNGDCTTFWIDDRWEDYGTENFRPPRNPRRKDQRKDRGFALINGDPKLKKKIETKRQRTKQEIFPSVQNGTRFPANECQKWNSLSTYGASGVNDGNGIPDA